MALADETSSVELITEEERAQLERLWKEGRLHHQQEQVLAFVREQRLEILQIAGEHRDLGALGAATRRLIARLRCVHQPSEMRDQVREMHNEIWYCGQRGDHDRSRITLEWAARHGSNWRRWRIKEYLFLADYCAAEIAAIVNPVP